MTTRNEILARVRAHQPPATPLPSIPAFAFAERSLQDAFRAGLERMGGTFVEEGASCRDLNALVRERFPDARVVCSATREVAGTRGLSAEVEPADLNDVDVGVVRALCGVGETGSVLVTESELVVNVLAFLSQHLVVLLDTNDLVANLHDAYRHPRLRTARYAAFLTGPSATADIEGVLVRGAQGIRSLTVVVCPRMAPSQPAG